MGKTEIILVLSIISAVIILFIVGFVLFVNQYRNRRLLFEQEKNALEEKYKIELLNNRLKTQQQTMQYIGNEIHDGVSQQLTLASLYARNLEHDYEDPPLRSKLNIISSIINDCLEELRELSHSLTDNVVQQKNLDEWLRTTCSRIDSTGGCKVELFTHINQPLPFSLNRSLQRVIQEFLQNSLKHSACSLIVIILNCSADGLTLQMNDNGNGFDMKHLQSDGIGLQNMKRRVQMAGGQFQLESKPGKGTHVEIFIDRQYLII